VFDGDVARHGNRLGPCRGQLGDGAICGDAVDIGDCHAGTLTG
jgi:hypothetical protein